MVVQQHLSLHQQQLVRWAACSVCPSVKIIGQVASFLPFSIQHCMGVVCRDSAKVATVRCVLFIGRTLTEPHDEVWWYEGSSRAGSLRVHSLTTGATQVPWHVFCSLVASVWHSSNLTGQSRTGRRPQC
jgi:hypothetical protein